MHGAPKVRAGPTQDRSNDMSKTDEILANAPNRLDDFYGVPAVLE